MSLNFRFHYELYILSRFTLCGCDDVVESVCMLGKRSFVVNCKKKKFVTSKCDYVCCFKKCY